MQRGMALAVNTLVVLILGVVILGLGLALVTKVYNKAVKLPAEVNRQTEQQLFSMLLNSDQKIAVLENVKRVRRGKDATYAVAFQNRLDGPEATFTVATQSLVSAPDGAEDCLSSPLDTCPTAVALEGPYTVQRYESKAFYVGVHVPKRVVPGEYVFEVRVQNGQGLYARTKIHAIVE